MRKITLYTQRHQSVMLGGGFDESLIMFWLEIHGYKKRATDRHTDQWTDRPMDGQTNGRTNQRTDRY